MCKKFFCFAAVFLLLIGCTATFGTGAASVTVKLTVEDVIKMYELIEQRKSRSSLYSVPMHYESQNGTKIEIAD